MLSSSSSYGEERLWRSCIGRLSSPEGVGGEGVDTEVQSMRARLLDALSPAGPDQVLSRLRVVVFFGACAPVVGDPTFDSGRLRDLAPRLREIVAD